MTISVFLTLISADGIFVTNRKSKVRLIKIISLIPEIQIVSLMAVGFSNKLIAEQLFITESTVKGHVNKIFAKLDVSDAVNALIEASKLGYIEQDYLQVG